MRTVPLILFFSIFVIACHAQKHHSNSQSAAEIRTKAMAGQEVLLNAKNDGQFSPLRNLTAGRATYCRKAKIFRLNDRAGFDPADREWLIQETSEQALASWQDHHYEVTRPYQNEKVEISPGISIERLDRFTLTYQANTLTLFHERGAPENSVYVDYARLTMRPYPGPHLWAEGYAYIPNGGTEPIGIYRIFSRPDQLKCHHSAYGNAPKWCRSILIEFYDASDSIGALNTPSKDVNVVLAENPQDCNETTSRETNDGEGDEGPNKPR